MNNYYNHEKNGETKLNEDTINNLNDFYIKSSFGDCNGIFNLSNFYMNHGKYFAGNNGSFSNSYNFNKIAPKTTKTNASTGLCENNKCIVLG